jgi:hypothetical protein
VVHGGHGVLREDDRLEGPVTAIETSTLATMTSAAEGRATGRAARGSRRTKDASLHH